jgi:SPP1 gp7 family putative phage head morphogenesis protein
MTDAQYGSLPFKEQIDFFRAKLPMPTQRWNDLVREQHDVSFVVAGAMKADLLADLQGAVDKAIAKGTTLAEFQKDFEVIVAKHGWTGWRGEDTEAGRAWRARVIYDTNLRGSYQAGRWQQIQQVRGTNPYLLYKHSDAVVHPRPLHKSWDGLVVAVDDPWVKAHWPPNGWGCRCQMFSLSDRDLARRGKDGPDTPPDDGTYEWADKKTGEVHEFPNGIDPFWDYTPGASRLGVVRDQAERKLADLPKPIAAALRDDLKKTAPAPQAERPPVPSAFSSNARLKPAEVLDKLLSEFGDQGALTRAALDKHGIKSLFLSSTETNAGSTKARAIAGDVNGFLGADQLGPFAFATRGRSLGFTSDRWRHVVVRNNSPKRTVVDAQKMRETVRRVIQDYAEGKGPMKTYIGGFKMSEDPASNVFRHWTFAQASDEAQVNLMIWAHEIGHQMHFVTGTESGLAKRSITKYGDTNRREWHAEQFVAWLFNREALAAFDQQIADYFDALMTRAAGG